MKSWGIKRKISRKKRQMKGKKKYMDEGGNMKRKNTKNVFS